MLWVVDGSFLEASSLLALVALLSALVVFVLMNENNLPAKLFLMGDPSLWLALVVMLSLMVLLLLFPLTLLVKITLLGVLAVKVWSSLLRGRWGFRPLTGALRQARKLQRCAIGNLSSLSSSFVPHSRLFSLHPSSQNPSLLHGSGAMNSCGFMHGVCMHDNSLVVHENSWCALGHKNSCSSHAAGVRGGTKAPSTSTRVRVRRSAVEKLASPQQTSSKLHVEVWEGLLSNQGMRFSQEEEIVPGCVVSGARPSCLDDPPEPPGPGRIIRNMFGWSQLEKTVRSGVWLFRGALRGENLFSSLCAAGDWVKKGSYHTAWAVPCDSSCSCSCAYGRGPAVGPQTGKWCWPLLAGAWRAIAHLMKPWCAEGRFANCHEPEPLPGMEFVCWLALRRRRTFVWKVWGCQAHCFSESW